MKRQLKAVSLVISIMVLLILISASSFITSNVMLNKTHNIVSEVIPINKDVQNLLLDLVNQETGIRGYIISAEPQFLEPYESGVSQFMFDLHKVEIYAGTHPDVKDVLELELMPQTAQINDFFKSQIALVSDGKIAEARAKIGNGKTLMDVFRSINNEIAKLVDNNMQNNLEAAKAASDRSNLVIISGAVLALFIGFFTILLFMNKESYRQAEKLQQLNEELSNEKNVIQRILESSHECILMTDKDGNIVFFNAQTKICFQLDDATQNIAAFCEYIRAHSEKSINIYEPIARFLADDSKDNMTLQFNFGSAKEEKYFDLYVTVIGGDKIEMTHGYLFVFRDRTEEEQILQMKNELISIVSHELRTPLSSILGFMEILLYRDLNPDKQKKYFQTIYDEAIRLSNLINDFLDLQRMESGLQRYHFTPVRVDLILRELANQWNGKQGHTINLSMHVKTVYIKADEDRLRQVLHNLLSNAVKYSPDADKIDISLDVNQQQVEITVQDYGLGIPEEAKRKLFTKFFRVDNSDRRQIGGTGLGLSICKEIVETHGGSLTFTSMMGEGSIFKVKLPEYRIVEVNRKIVIVGNRDIVTQSFQSILDSIGIPIVQIHSAPAFVLALEQCRADEGPMLCFVDLNLQGLVTGWNVLDRLYARSAVHRAPVIILRSIDWFENMNEYEIEMQIKKTTAIRKVTETIHYLIDKEHQLTYVFPTQDESIVDLLIEHGMKIMNINRNTDFIEVELLPSHD
jgi:signal transduction histidine kinase